MSNDVKLEIGTSAEEMGRRFVDAWHAAERGEHQAPRDVLIFDSLEGMLKCLSEQKLNLLKHLAKRPEPSIRSLALHLKRDYRRVHSDVHALLSCGLVKQEGKQFILGARSAEARINFDEVAH